MLKESLREAMVQDYVLLARLKGMSRLRLVLQEALRNAVAPTLALTGVQFTFLIGGTVIVERIFSYPGIGNMAIDAVINRDLPLIQGLTLVFGALFIVVNMVVDLLVDEVQSEAASWLTPRSARAMRTPRTDGSRRFARASREPKVVVGGGFILFLLVLALVAPWIAPKDPLEQDIILGATPPAWMAGAEAGPLARHRRPRPRHSLARDLRVARRAHGRLRRGEPRRRAGVRAWPACGLAARLGRRDRSRALVEIWMAFPPVLLSILLVAVVGAGVGSVIAAIAIIDWTRFCRVVRAETINAGEQRLCDRGARRRLLARRAS